MVQSGDFVEFSLNVVKLNPRFDGMKVPEKHEQRQIQQATDTESGRGLPADAVKNENEARERKVNAERMNQDSETGYQATGKSCGLRFIFPGPLKTQER